jgi:cell division protein FtsI (penicillin-binding protein 3)
MTELHRAAGNPCRPRHFKPNLCAPAPAEGPVRTALETSHVRLIVAAALFLAAFLVIGGQLVYVMGFRHGDFHAARPQPVVKLATDRADITDRNGVLLATTVASSALFANPKEISNPQQTAADLARILPDTSADELYAKLTEPNKSFVWIKRQLSSVQELQVNALGVPGLRFQAEERRIYPKANLLAHVTGFTGIDGKGLAGIERGLDGELRGGEPARLSIDSRVQYILRDAITRQIEQFSAIGGMGIVMDVTSGEVLALASLPDFDPNDPGDATPDQIFNRATLGTYEMGSTFKIFNTAMVLESRVATINTQFDASHPLEIDRFTIHDDHPQNRWLSVAEVFEYSSNIGSARMALAAGIDRQRDFLGRLGLLREPRFELPEVSAPLIPSPWRTVNSMTIAFGHGMSVSPLQMATAVSAVVNGGILYPPTLLAHDPDHKPAGLQVMSPTISEEMRRLLRLVVTGGTGKFAESQGYVVGGKTGTAEKVAGRHYARKELLSSFIGVFPINDPRYLVMISIDEPHGNHASSGFATGGWVAAPGVGQVVERMAPLVGIHPVDENLPEISQALMIDMPVPEGRKLAAD